jgi:hypothetical protein
MRAMARGFLNWRQLFAAANLRIFRGRVATEGATVVVSRMCLGTLYLISRLNATGRGDG